MDMGPAQRKLAALTEMVTEQELDSLVFRTEFYNEGILEHVKEARKDISVRKHGEAYNYIANTLQTAEEKQHLGDVLFDQLNNIETKQFNRLKTAFRMNLLDHQTGDANKYGFGGADNAGGYGEGETPDDVKFENFLSNLLQKTKILHGQTGYRLQIKLPAESDFSDSSQQGDMDSRSIGTASASRRAGKGSPTSPQVRRRGRSPGSPSRMTQQGRSPKRGQGELLGPDSPSRRGKTDAGEITGQERLNALGEDALQLDEMVEKIRKQKDDIEMGLLNYAQHVRDVAIWMEDAMFLANHAAVKIQSHWKGFVVRHRVLYPMYYACIDMQRLVRGHLDRKFVAAYRTQKLNAVMIIQRLAIRWKNNKLIKQATSSYEEYNRVKK